MRNLVICNNMIIYILLNIFISGLFPSFKIFLKLEYLTPGLRTDKISVLSLDLDVILNSQGLYDAATSLSISNHEPNNDFDDC